eukprot:Tamp_30345.p2 GENE.Tamp_30345~~Tamp_30345.p2  ORF type:complete len:163 (+),score=26.62 Tamp_30345:30-518(+)
MSSGTGRCRRAVRWCLRALLLFTAAAGCLSAAHAPPPSSADGVLSAADAIPPPQTRRPAPAPSCDEVFVGGLEFSLTTADVKCAFSQFGSVLEVKLPSGETEGHANKGYSFVRYKDPRSCILAVENMDGTVLCGRRLSVNMSRGKAQTRPALRPRRDFAADV